jgi:hypothetical protein
MLDKGTLVVCGVAAFVGVTLLASQARPGETPGETPVEIMQIGCDNIYMTRVQLNTELESRDDRRIAIALKEQVRRGNCANSRRGARLDYTERKMSCSGTLCQWFIRTNVFEEVCDGAPRVLCYAKANAAILLMTDAMTVEEVEEKINRKNSI